MPLLHTFVIVFGVFINNNIFLLLKNDNCREDDQLHIAHSYSLAFLLIFKNFFSIILFSQVVLFIPKIGI